MTNPPGARPGTEAATAGVVRQATPTPRLSSRVKVVNSVSNGAGCIRRRDAEHFLAEGRAVYVGREAGRDLIRLVESHPKNRTAAIEAARRDQNGFDEHRDGFVLWNGGAGFLGTHIPGRIVS